MQCATNIPMSTCQAIHTGTLRWSNPDVPQAFSLFACPYAGAMNNGAAIDQEAQELLLKATDRKGLSDQDVQKATKIFLNAPRNIDVAARMISVFAKIHQLCLPSIMGGCSISAPTSCPTTTLPVGMLCSLPRCAGSLTNRSSSIWECVPMQHAHPWSATALFVLTQPSNRFCLGRLPCMASHPSYRSRLSDLVCLSLPLVEAEVGRLWPTGRLMLGNAMIVLSMTRGVTQPRVPI
eukprot:scaffold36481_cov44-Attheya_sp.AAC.1